MFRGQCAEYCGAEHARMRFVVQAEPPGQFNAWIEAQRRPAPSPVTPSQKQGLNVFLSSPCIMCHTIQGTPARATLGPNLTHLASRPMLAAGTFPNKRGYLAGWILDPQRLKPGVRMPANPLTPTQLHPILDYLESLR
jgi:cytochrome c oxidase subunit 2